VLQLPALGILAGMNEHGRLSIANMVGSLVSVVAVIWVLLWMKLGLFALALAASLPLLAINAIYSPIQVCRCLGLPVWTYFNQTILYAMIRTLPFAICLLASRWLFGDDAKLSVLVGCASGGAIMVPIYWFSVVPKSLKTSLCRKISWRPTPSSAAVTCPETNG